MDSKIYIVSRANGTINNTIYWTRYLYSNGWQRLLYYSSTPAYTGTITHPFPFGSYPFFTIGVANGRASEGFTRDLCIQNNTTTSFNLINFSSASQYGGQMGCIVFEQFSL